MFRKEFTVHIYELGGHFNLLMLFRSFEYQIVLGVAIASIDIDSSNRSRSSNIMVK